MRLSGRRLRALGLVVTSIAMLCFGSICEANTVVSNLGYAEFSSVTANSGGSVYESFIAGTDVRLADVQLSLINGDTHAGTVSLVLLSDNLGVPGVQLANLGSLGVPAKSYSSSLYEFDAPTHTALTAGTQYWLELTGDTSGAGWVITTSRSQTGVAGWSIGDNAIFVGTSSTSYVAPVQFRVDAVPTPEAAAGGLVLLGMIMGIKGLSGKRAHRR